MQNDLTKPSSDLRAFSKWSINHNITMMLIIYQVNLK